MEFSQLIEERRSIRHYDESKKVTKEQIEEMVQAAIQAPSWKTLRQPDIMLFCPKTNWQNYLKRDCRSLTQKILPEHL